MFARCVSFFILLAKTSDVVLNSSNNQGHSCFISDFEENVSKGFPSSVMFAIDYAGYVLLRAFQEFSSF